MSSCDSLMSDTDVDPAVVAAPPQAGDSLPATVAPASAIAPEPELEPQLQPKIRGSPRTRLRELQVEISQELAANDEAFSNREWQGQLLEVLESRDYWKDQYERYRRKYDMIRTKYVFVVERHNNLVLANVRIRDRLRDLEKEFFDTVLAGPSNAEDEAIDEARVRDYVLDDLREAIPEETQMVE